MIRIDVPVNVLESFCEKWNIVEFSLFGSVLRDDYTEESDIDCLITFAKEAEWNLYDLVDMEEKLCEIFGKPVDLVLSSALKNPFKRNAIMRSREVIIARPGT